MEKKGFMAVGKIPSGLFIICVQDPTTKIIDGFLGSWVQQASFSPLLISLAIKPGRPAYDLISQDTIFTINIVGETDKSFLKHFWTGYDPTKNPFKEIPHTITPQGGISLDQGLSWMDLQKVDQFRPGDHDLVIAKVIDHGLIVGKEEQRPMVHVRKSGLDY